MKSNLFKYIFAIFVIVLICVAVYIMTKEENNDTDLIKTDVKPEYINILPNVNMAIVGFDTINPLNSKNKNVQDISKLIYEPLLTLTSDYKIEEKLASEYSKISNKSYIIKLNENKKFSNGEKVTSKDIEATINKIKNNVESIYYPNVKDIVRIECIDNTTIKLELDKEIAFFEYNLTFPILETKSIDLNIPNGTGMYKVAEILQDKIVLARNLQYENSQNFKIDKININLYSSIGEVYNDFKIGNVDFINTNNINYEDYVGKIGYSIKNTPYREHTYIALNCENKVLKNIETRQAIQKLIDKSNIVSSIYKNKYFVANNPLEYGSYLSNNSNYVLTEDTVKDILVIGGWSYSEGVWNKNINNEKIKTELNLMINSANELHINIANNIKNQLDISGIKVNIVKLSSSEYYKNLENKNYDLAIITENVSISPNLEKYFGENNIANYYNEDINSTLKEIKDINDEKLLKEKYNKLLEKYVQDVPYISICFNSNIIIYNSNLLGNMTPNFYNLFYNIDGWYKKEEN